MSEVCEGNYPASISAHFAGNRPHSFSITTNNCFYLNEHTTKLTYDENK